MWAQVHNSRLYEEYDIGTTWSHLQNKRLTTIKNSDERNGWRWL